MYGRPPATLFLIGDPKQAIYGFRSADVFAYRRARLDAGASIHTLATNHRSGPGLVAAVSALFENRERAFYLDWIEFPHTTAHRANDRLALAGRPLEPFELLFVERDGRALDPVGPIPRSAAQEVLVPALVADDLVRFLDSGATLDSRRVEPGDIAVLVRTNRQADKVQGQLRLRGVPSVLYGDASVLDTAEAAEIEQVLGAVAEPARAPAVRVALSTSIFGLDGSSIARLRDDETGWEEWTGKLERWRRTWFDRGFIQLFRMILEELEVEPRLLECVDGERRMTNLRHLGELLHTTSGRLHLGPTGLVNWLKTVRNDRAAREHGEMEDAQIRLESDEKAVRLVTIHGSKGLQYPVVYCPFLWVGHPSGSDAGGCLLFHGGADREVLTLDLGSESRDRSERLALEEALSENLRLTYVALTRAESRLVLVWGCFAGGIDSPLGYLLDPRRRAGQPPFETPAGGRARKGSDEPTDDRMIAAVEEAFAGAEAHLRIVRRSPPEELRTYVPERHDEVEPVSREVREAARRRYRVSSFTDLSTAHEAPTAQRESGLDRDAAGTSAAGPPVAELAGEPEAALAGRVPLADFPKGKNAGSFLHGVLEELEFDSADPERIGELVARFAPRFGLAGRVDSSGISRAFASVLATPLTGDGLTLRSVTSESRLTELEFTLPAGRDRPVTGAAIAEVFARHGSARVPASYPGCLERLDFPALRGYLKGFIDLAFVHHDRWFVVDYKSNHLGDRWVDYGEALLDRAMEVHHYYLQYHLYVAALHRYLKLRWPPDRPPYDYEAHFGGVLYLFLRGMSPETGACGVFSDRPSLAMVEALLAVMDRAEPGGAA
ncbi:MAG: UvrD-helicase domain-containing protein [Candidatus Riflebacteria bacterium]|nr:UvrD-helicase domain-containing protein [Candidatus Riflebacteria bacterium]